MIHAYICTHIQTIHPTIHSGMHTYIHGYIHTYLYSYIQMHTYIHTHKRPPQCCHCRPLWYIRYRPYLGVYPVPPAPGSKLGRGDAAGRPWPGRGGRSRRSRVGRGRCRRRRRRPRLNIPVRRGTAHRSGHRRTAPLWAAPTACGAVRPLGAGRLELPLPALRPDGWPDPASPPPCLSASSHPAPLPPRCRRVPPASHFTAALHWGAAPGRRNGFDGGVAPAIWPTRRWSVSFHTSTHMLRSSLSSVWVSRNGALLWLCWIWHWWTASQTINGLRSVGV